MTRQPLTKLQEHCLRNQVISDDQPGTLLRDFQTILDFLGPEGVEAGGKYHLLPQNHIEELDYRMSRPLGLKPKRPMLKSYPYLLGLNLLLRASGLGRVDQTGSKARLLVDPEMGMQWDQLNPTEQYFNLLEAWLRFGRAEIIGEWDSPLQTQFRLCLQVWQQLPIEGVSVDLKDPRGAHIPGIYREIYVVTLMDLFGLVKLEHPRPPVMPWLPSGLQHVPFGDALLNLIATHFHSEREMDLKLFWSGDKAKRASEVPRFGAWQPRLQPYFPAWKKNLELPEPESREGTFVFRVSLGKVWRLIAIPADGTLEDLAQWIIRSVDFDNDHLYQFNYQGRLGSTESAKHPYMEEGPSTDEVSIGTLPLALGQTMVFVYDFGDNWEFTVKLERIEPPGGKTKGARIVEKHGKSPVQYPNADW